MANLVLGIATSHTPMLTLPAELWSSYARNDERNRELAFPPHGIVMSYEARSDGVDADSLIRQILKAIPAPEKLLESHVRVA